MWSSRAISAFVEPAATSLPLGPERGSTRPSPALRVCRSGRARRAYGTPRSERPAARESPALARVCLWPRPCAWHVVQASPSRAAYDRTRTVGGGVDAQRRRHPSRRSRRRDRLAPPKAGPRSGQRWRTRCHCGTPLCGSELVKDFRGFFESPERDQGLDIQGPNEQLVVPSRAPPDRTQPLAVLLQARVSRSRLP